MFLKYYRKLCSFFMALSLMKAADSVFFFLRAMKIARKKSL